MIEVEQHGPVTVFRMARALLGRPLYWTAAYWIDGLLIDTGPAVTAPELVSALQPYPVQQIAITHGHEDHIGGLALLMRTLPNVRVYAPRMTISMIQDPSRIGMQAYRRLIWGTPQPVESVLSLDAVNDAIKTPEYTLRAVETPGHSRDHVSYYESGHRWLFSGDAFIGGRDVAWTPEFDMFAIVSSLRTMASLRPERLFPGSGRVRRTPLPDLMGKVGDLVKLAGEVARLDANGYSVDEIVTMLFDGEPRIKFWTMGHFSAANLVAACREYNAVFSPMAPDGSGLGGSGYRSAGDLPDSSTNRSAGPGDVRR